VVGHWVLMDDEIPVLRCRRESLYVEQLDSDGIQVHAGFLVILLNEVHLHLRIEQEPSILQYRHQQRILQNNDRLYELIRQNYVFEIYKYL